jgi:hypothetical protein
LSQKYAHLEGTSYTTTIIIVSIRMVDDGGGGGGDDGGDDDGVIMPTMTTLAARIQLLKFFLDYSEGPRFAK